MNILTAENYLLYGTFHRPLNSFCSQAVACPLLFYTPLIVHNLSIYNLSEFDVSDVSDVDQSTNREGERD